MSGPSKRFNDKDLLTLLNHFETVRRSYEQRLWDTVKYFTTLITAILSVTVGLLTATGRFSTVSNSTLTSTVVSSETRWMPLTLPLLGLILTFLGWLNLKREYRWAEDVMTIVIKLRHALGLEDGSFLAGYSHDPEMPFGPTEALLPIRWTEPNLSGKSSEEWISAQLRVFARLHLHQKYKGEMGFYPLFSVVFLILAFFNIVMIALVVFS